MFTKKAPDTFYLSSLTPFICPDIEVIYTNYTVSLQVGSGGLLGDVNLDGVVNFLDINPFLNILAGQ